jgi:hypothetical protein
MYALSMQSIGKNGRLLALAAALAIGGTVGSTLIAPPWHAASAAMISVTVRERLSNYGNWHRSTRFGEVWIPTVSEGWRPYTDGTWIWTDDGWYWQSDEPFGAVVFHYGRWAYDDDLGGVWIAGDEWAPAWVVWRESDDEIGWAPAPPPDEVAVVAESWWAFAPVAAIGAVNILTDIRPVSENVTIIRETTVINNTTIINNYGGKRTVRLGNAVVPVDAGPALARLPKSTLASLKAAKVTPPKPGKVVEARLDPTKGSAIKRLAVSRQPAESIVAGPKQTGPGGGRIVQGKRSASAHGPKTRTPGNVVAGKAAPIGKQVVVHAPLPAGHAVPVRRDAQRKGQRPAMTGARIERYRTRAAGEAAIANKPVHHGAIGGRSSRSARNPIPMNTRHGAPTNIHAERAIMRHPPVRPAMARHPSEKCNPRNPNCKHRG